MPYGLIVEGESGRLLIDPDFSCYGVLYSGTLAVNQDYGMGSNRTGVLDLPGNRGDLIVLFRPPVGRLVSYQGSRVYVTGGNMSLPYTVLATASELPQPLDAYGLRVWDSAGQVVFDSGHTLGNTISTYTYRGTSLPTVTAGSSDWLAADTAGITWMAPDGSGQFTFMLGTFLEKLGNGNLRAHREPIWRVGRVNVDNTGARNSISLTRMTLR